MLSTATSLRDLGSIFWGWKMREQTVNREFVVPSTSMAAQQSLVCGSGHSSHRYLHIWNRCAPALPSRDAPTLQPRAVQSTSRGTDGAENKTAKRSILAQTSSLSGLPSGHSNTRDAQDGGRGFGFLMQHSLFVQNWSVCETAAADPCSTGETRRGWVFLMLLVGRCTSRAGHIEWTPHGRGRGPHRIVPQRISDSWDGIAPIS